jgi:hypothetical protein
VNIFEDEIVEFMQLLNKNNVRSILVGGLAVNYHGYSRSTGDIDLWIEDSADNRQRLVNAMTEYGIEGAEMFLDHPLVAGYAEVLLNNGVYLDLMSNMIALKQDQFHECFKLSEKYKLSKDTSVSVLHINKLIEEKSKSTRSKDLEDVKELRHIRDQKNNSPN